MKEQRSNYRFALILSILISVLLNFIFVLIFVYGRGSNVPHQGEEMRPLFDIKIILNNLFFNFLLSFLLYLWNFKIQEINTKNVKWRLVFIILTTFILTFLMSYLFSYLELSFIFDPVPERRPHLIKGAFIRDFFITVIVLFSSQLVYLWRKQQQTALENQKLLAENMQTRYQALKHQVDPHFLFNSLNTLNSLIKTDPEKAEKYVHQLASVFRYTLQQKTIIPLKEEIQFTKAYCDLMQIRYGDSLSFDFQIDDPFLNYLIIPLSLQTLVENAIKHNVISHKQPLHVIIKSNENEIITVSNPIQPKKDVEDGEHIGLTNLSERYRLMAQKEIVIAKINSVFSVSIPIFKDPMMV